MPIGPAEHPTLNSVSCGPDVFFSWYCYTVKILLAAVHTMGYSWIQYVVNLCAVHVHLFPVMYTLSSYSLYETAASGPKVNSC